MANGVNRRNGNGDWEGEWTPDGGDWWDGRTTDPNNIPPDVDTQTLESLLPEAELQNSGLGYDPNSPDLSGADEAALNAYYGGRAGTQAAFPDDAVFVEGGDPPPPPGLGVSTDPWTTAGEGFQTWLGQGGPETRAWSPETEALLGGDYGARGWNPETREWEERAYDPWTRQADPEGVAGAQAAAGWDRGALAAGTGAYAPGGEFFDAGQERRGLMDQLFKEYQGSPFGQEGALSAFEQDYNRRFGPYVASQAEERQKYADIVAQGGTPVVDPVTGLVQPWTPPDSPPPPDGPPPPPTDGPPPPPPDGPPPPPPPDGPPPPPPPIGPGTTGTGAGVQPPSVGDQPLTTEQIQTLLDELLKRTNVLPGQTPAWEQVSGVPVGVDPLSRLANVNLATLLQTGGVAPTPMAGQTEATLSDVLRRRGVAADRTGLGGQVETELEKLLTSGGAAPTDRSREAMELEAARSPLDRLRQAQLAQGSAAMAQRGILGMGPEAAYRERLESRLAPAYAEAGQQLELAKLDRQDQRYQQAIQSGQAMSTQEAALQEQRLGTAMQLATGMSAEQSRNVLNTVSTLGERQQMLNDMALGSLDRNIEWNKFLAEFGLDRYRVANDIQQGRIDAILPILQTYLKGAEQAAAGYIA